nr:LysR substrate-binding domain-containing protein [Terribacillus saccharophilus]
MLKAGYALRYTVDDMFQQAQLTPDVIFEGEEVATVAGFVAEGLGISILPDLEGLD